MQLRPGLPVLALCLVFPSLGGLAAATIGVDSRIDAVTVFPDRAEVTRAARLALPEGDSTIILEGLPASLIPESVRVRGAAGEAVKIGSVETRQVFAEAAVREEERRLEREIEELQDRRRALDDRKSALKLQLDFIAALGREAPQNANEEIVRGDMKPESWRQAWTLLSGGAAEALDGIHKAELEQRGIDRKVRQKKQQLNRVRTGQRSRVTASVNVSAGQRTSLRLELSYQLPGAGWRPLYDARLDTAASRVAVTQLGEVRQRTGEDWSGVKLTLSTARPAVSARMPDLQSWFVDFAPAPGDQKRGRGFFDEAEEGLSETRREPDAPAEKSAAPGGQLAQAPAPVAAVVAGEFTAEYRIAGQASVPADNAPHKFVIGEREVEAALAVRVVPKVAPLAYLYAGLANAGADPLLPGPVSVFRDGAFIGTGGLALWRPGETQDLSFGVDDRVQVDYRLVDGERSREGLINKDRRLERHYRTAVTNRHERPMPITVLDQLPVPRDDRIKVRLLGDSTPPAETDVDGRKGVLAWTATYEPGETRTVLFAYAVAYPEAQTLPGF